MTGQQPQMLLAVSGSRASHQATLAAADLASAFSAQLTILHVVEPLRYRVARLGPTLPITQRLDDPLTNQVLLDARRVAWTRGASVKTMLIAGDPEHTIVTVAGDLGAELLVIGRTDRLWPSALSAPVRRWVNAHAPCPVVLITADRPPRPRPRREPVPVT